MSTLKQYADHIRRLDNRIAVAKSEIKKWESKIKDIVGSTKAAKVAAHYDRLSEQIGLYEARRDELLEEIQEGLDAIDHG